MSGTPRTPGWGQRKRITLWHPVGVQNLFLFRFPGVRRVRLTPGYPVRPLWGRWVAHNIGADPTLLKWKRIGNIPSPLQSRTPIKFLNSLRRVDDKEDDTV